VIRQLTAWLPPVLLYALITVQSSFPMVIARRLIPHQDKIAHFLIFALLSGLIARGLSTVRPCTVSLGRCLVAAAAVATLLGVVDEIHQAFNPARTAEVLDACADLGGAIVGAGLFGYIARRHAARGDVDGQAG